jgi:hypothetical protein
VLVVCENSLLLLHPVGLAFVAVASCCQKAANLARGIRFSLQIARATNMMVRCRGKEHRLADGSYTYMIVTVSALISTLLYDYGNMGQAHQVADAADARLLAITESPSC